MSVSLEGYSKLASTSGTGTGAGNYINVYNTGFGTVTQLTGISICNSDTSDDTFKLWQTDQATWVSVGDWDSGANVEPVVAIKDRIFYNTEVPANMTIFLPVDVLMDGNQYLIFEGSTNLNITLWGVNDPYVPATVDVIDNFIELNDTPLNYIGKSLNLLQVNVGETAVEFTSTPTISSFINATHNHSNAAGGSNIAAGSTTVVSTGFSGNLSAADTDVQLALTTLDGMPTGGPGSDTTAIHDDTAAEISAIAAKGSPTTSDYLLIEDAADGDSKKSIQIGNLPTIAGIDSTAIHDNVASEISTITEKAIPITTDIVIIEDSADGNNKKRIQLGNIPGGFDITNLKAMFLL